VDCELDGSLRGREAKGIKARLSLQSKRTACRSTAPELAILPSYAEAQAARPALERGLLNNARITPFPHVNCFSFIALHEPVRLAHRIRI